MNATDRFSGKGGGALKFPQPYPYFGKVIDRADPEKIGRIKVRIPGALDISGWMLPLGQTFSGAPGKGGPMPPPLDAIVVVMFVGGDIEHGVYFSGPWPIGAAPEGNETSTDGDSVIFQTERIRVKLDSRASGTVIRLEDIGTGKGSTLTLDMDTLQSALAATTGSNVQARGAVGITGAATVVGGRPVLPTPEYPLPPLPDDVSIPMGQPYCPPVPDPPERLKLTMPGGLVMNAIPLLEGGITTEISSVQNLLTQAAPALGALQPILMIVDAVTAIFGVVEGVLGLFNGDVAGFIESLDEAREKITRLASLSPQVSVVMLVKDLISLIVASLRAIESMLRQVQELNERAELLISEAQAAGNIPLEQVGICVQNQASQMAKHLGASLGPIGDIMAMASKLLDFVPGSPSLPSIDDLSGESIEDILAAISAILDTLEGIGF